MRFFFERYYNSECQVTNRLIFILWLDRLILCLLLS